MHLLIFPIFLLCASLALGSSPRQWTSADGLKHFSGTYLSRTQTHLTIRKTDGRRVTFSPNLLSQKDKEWVLSQPVGLAITDIVEESATSLNAIAKKLASKTWRLVGKRMKREASTKNPKYYLVYFSASW